MLGGWGKDDDVLPGLGTSVPLRQYLRAWMVPREAGNRQTKEFRALGVLDLAIRRTGTVPALGPQDEATDMGGKTVEGVGVDMEAAGHDDRRVTGANAVGGGRNYGSRWGAKRGGRF